MAVPVGWICTKCGKETRKGEKPGPTFLGKCSGSSSGVHNWKKTGN